MPRFLRILSNALRLRCPRCGQHKLYERFLRMYDRCPVCGTPFDRGPGFYLGAIYINYGFVSLLAAIAYPLLVFTGTLDRRVALWSLLAVITALPLLLFRHARSLWLGFDELVDPQDERGTSHRRSGQR